MLNWKTIHYLSYLALIYFLLEPSYIHPDEHFQSFEVLMKYHHGTSTTIPWEFSPESPSRSFAVLRLVYSPLIWLNRWLKFSPLGLLYLIRLQLCVWYFFVVQYAMKILNDNRKQEYTKALFFVFTSYVTWVYQVRSFSNSLETILVLIALSLFHLILKRKENQREILMCATLGVVFAIGEFNRITFAGFLLLPALKLTRFFLTNPLSLITLIATFALTSYVLVLIDTSFYNSSGLVITPLNNFLYNIQTSNLAQHGLHPRYTHLLVNLPQIIGPMIIPIIFRNHYKTSLSYLSIISGLISLSIFPHQELRFLVPLVPLLCNCIDFRNTESQKFVNVLISVWVVFNVVFGVIMGSFHQRGVIVALDHLREVGFNGTQIWWKTYKPPTWILGSNHINIGGFKDKSANIIDLMGASSDELIESFKDVSSGNTYLITPRSSVPLLESLEPFVKLDKLWSYDYHLDLDHFDVADIRTFYPGIDVYNVTLL
ncbi:hypothetical protein WICPIJ_006706 [Wickerhamomyces pijperi]|uniref:Mannosyltransferase n=1 Tax=Wickerhamomyces pijperi TaxID=599730 RepID=A0A9P8Q3Y3_WICPI|nr:hypothetical protein WICPIJ_006706 [Wickerhamomyces pijperi]